MNVLFWIGIVVFAIGFILRYVFKFKYFRDYKVRAHTALQKQEMRTRYRPVMFVSLAIEGAGCIITLISVW